MKLLLDTHILLWTVARSPALPQRAIDLLEDDENIVVASALSVWEAAIKYALRRGTANDMPMSGRQLLSDIMASDTELLSITPRHAAAVDDLPMLHRDPFDRLLVAQAWSESMHLLTHDDALAGYGNFVITV